MKVLHRWAGCTLFGTMALWQPLPLGAQFPRVRDSASVHIVGNSARRDAAIAFKVDERPVLDLGGLRSNPEDEFTVNGGNLRIVGLSSGGYVAIDGSKLRYYDSRGKPQRVVGRHGQGPGEFSSIEGVCVSRGDSLVISDPANGRVTIVDAMGRPVKQIPTGIASLPWDHACFDDGTWLMTESFGDEALGRALRLVRRRLDGTIVGTPWSIWGGRSGLYLPMQPSVTVLGRLVFVGDPRSSEVRIYDQQGALRRVIRTNDPVAKISAREQASLRPAYYLRVGSPGTELEFAL